MARAAAREAGPTAPAMAVALIDQALGLVLPGTDDRGLRAERARLLVWAGRVAEGEAEARAVLDEGVSGIGAVDVRSGLALALLLQGRLAESLGHLEALTAHPDLPADQRSHLTAEAALVRLLTGDRARAVRDDGSFTRGVPGRGRRADLLPVPGHAGVGAPRRGPAR